MALNIIHTYGSHMSNEVISKEAIKEEEKYTISSFNFDYLISSLNFFHWSSYHMIFLLVLILTKMLTGPVRRLLMSCRRHAWALTKIDKRTGAQGPEMARITNMSHSWLRRTRTSNQSIHLSYRNNFCIFHFTLIIGLIKIQTWH